MKTKRNENIEIIKFFAISLVVLQHITTVCNINVKYNIIKAILTSGGFIGVTIFLLLSGFDIYQYLNNHKDSYNDFIIGRWKRLSKHYYLSLFITLFFSSMVVYLNRSYLFHIISHIFYFHNLFYSMHGSISGVCWTLGVIFQFYLIAPFLKKLVDKFPKISVLLSLIVTVGLKYIIFLKIIPVIDGDSFYYFIYGSQLFTSLDIFVLGMYFSKYHNEDKMENSLKNYASLIVSLGIFLFYILILRNYFNFLNGEIYTNNLKSVLAFSGLAIISYFVILFYNRVDIKLIKLKQFIVNLNKHQYAFYIWHLILLNTLLSADTFIYKIIYMERLITIPIIYVILLTLCILIDLVVSSIDFNKIYRQIKEIILNNIKYIKYGFILILIVLTLSLVKETFIDLIHIKDNLSCQGSCIIAENVKSKINCESKECTYIYVDKQDTGYLYFYQLRYYLTPIKSKDHYNNYVYYIESAGQDEMMNYLKEIKPDYVIVKDNEYMRNNGYELDLINGKIYTIDYNSKSFDKLLVEVK